VDEQAQLSLLCPKCGIEMKPMWRGSGPLRCPQCRGIFLDTEEMRLRRGERKKPAPAAIAARVIINVIVSVALSVAISRWVKQRKEKARQLADG